MAFPDRLARLRKDKALIQKRSRSERMSDGLTMSSAVSSRPYRGSPTAGKRPPRRASWKPEVPGVGIEPTWDFSRGILSPLRLPFRHPAKLLLCNHLRYTHNRRKRWRGENDVIHCTSRSSVSCVTTRSMVSSSGHWYAFLSASRLSHPPACATSTSGKLFRELAQSRR